MWSVSCIPIAPVRGADVVDAFVGFGIEPVVVAKTPTRKRDDLRPHAVDNPELQLAVERCGSYQFPFHNRL